MISGPFAFSDSGHLTAGDHPVVVFALRPDASPHQPWEALADALPLQRVETAQELKALLAQRPAVVPGARLFFAGGVTTALRDDTGPLRGYGKVFRDLTSLQLSEQAESTMACRLAAEALAMLWRFGGHEVVTAHSGPEALVFAKSYRPQAIFLDLGWSGMTGDEVAESLRDDSGSIGVVLIAPTGLGIQEDRRRTQEAGSDHRLVKPVDAAAVEAIIQDFSRRKKRRPVIAEYPQLEGLRSA